MKKKVFSLFELCFFFVAAYLMFGLSVNAYIDPSVVTYTIQVGAGIIIAIGAVVGIYFRKAKKKISNKLGIDENKNKEVESDDILEEVEDKKEEKKQEKKQEIKKESVNKEPTKETKNNNNKNKNKNNKKK